MSDTDDLKRQLAEAHARIRELEIQTNLEWIETVGDSVFIADAATMKLLYVNSNAARRFGYSREDLLRRTLKEIEVPNSDKEVQQIAWKSHKSATYFYECHYRHKDGTPIPVEVSSRLIQVDGQSAMQNIVRDASRRKKIEAEREQLIAELDAYGHTVAHDLKAPLTTLIACSEMLLTDSNHPPQPAHVEYLTIISNVAQKMNKIIDELLLLATLRNPNDTKIVPLRMPQLVQEVLCRLRTMIQESGAEIRILDADKWPTAYGYPAWIEEVWANTISNAIKYGGTPPRIELGANAQPDGLIGFWVRDNGQGISPEQQAHIFKPFTRLHDTPIEGHGLGLSIVQRIVERLDGQVYVESTPGQGSIFCFCLPAVQNPDTLGSLG